MPDDGTVIPDPWSRDLGIVDTIKQAVVASKKRAEFGPRNRKRVVFRASELGDLVAARDHKGEAAGCARKVFYSFFPESFARSEMSAETLLNFDEGDAVEDRIEVYLREAGLYVEGQVRFGAWAACKGTPVGLGDDVGVFCQDPAKPGCGVSPHVHGDHRFPDRSGGLVRGKADFIIKHPKHGVMPLEWKSCSTYVFDMVKKGGPKPENALQALFYAHEMGTEYGALGYTNKETRDFVIFVAKAQPGLMETVFARALLMRAAIEANALPEMPVGARAATAADPPGSRRSGNKRLPDAAYYDRAWPCYTYAAKKDIVIACPYYTACHGAAPDKPTRSIAAATRKRANPLLKGSSSFEFK